MSAAMTVLAAGPSRARAAARRVAARRPLWLIGAGVMAVVAYVPSLMSSPGKMPADTKLYLYLNPERLLSDSLWSYDSRQFAGWVPHQIIAYLWPAGPWYTVAQGIGLPDWVAHRLWIGTIMFAAGAGVAWAARRLGLSLVAAVAAGLLYQLSPYLVPYISRTSSMLLPWAGLGWIIGLTVGAATRSKWRDAALCALVVASVGSVNGTAVTMIAPAPVLWLIVATAERRITSRRAVATAAKIGGLSLLTCAWWLVMQSIQSEEGADLLAFSESLQDVSLTATSVEVWRSLGYWLTYVSSAFAPTTSAGRDYMTATAPLYLGFVVVIVSVAGLAVTRFAARRYAVVLTFTGLVLAVGVHRFTDPSPLADWFRGDGESGLALALRSSTRALPVMSIGLALGAGALVDAIGWKRPSLRIIGAGTLVLAALGNLPVLVGHRLVDPALERDEYPPAAWYDAAAALDQLPEGYRVLQLPGTEFGAYRWGYTVDPPLPGLTDRPLVTRDLLPLGSAATMDLLYALDDRFQQGRAEAGAVAPIARLLGADVIWLTGDGAFERFRTPRPELTSEFFAEAAGDDASGLGEPEPYGEPAANIPGIPLVDEQSMSEPVIGDAIAPVELVPVEDPVPIIRATDDVIILSGSGDGLVDAAAAGLIDGNEAILYSASLESDDLLAAAADAGFVIVTDSNRVRARNWRGSQETTGYTETGTGSAVVWPDSGDARLDVFTDDGVVESTTARSDGPTRAIATSYGARFVYEPESRPAMAIDGDPNTAWTVIDPANQFIEVQTDSGVDHVTLLQPNGLADVRHLRDVRISVNGGERFSVTLDDRSLVAGQPVEFPATTGPTTIRIYLGAMSGRRHAVGPDRSGVGFAEIDTGLGASPEVVAVPTDLTTALREGDVEVPVTFVLTRERVRPTDRLRSDPEWRIVRLLDVPFDQEVTVGVDVRLDRRASDTVLASLLGIEGPTATSRLTGAAVAGGWAAADGDPATAWITPFGQAYGATLNVDLVDPAEPLRIRQPVGNYSRITRVALRQGAQSVEVDVPTPGRDGWSDVAVPDGFDAGATAVEIVGLLEQTTRDARYADTVLMPTAVTELGNVAPSVVPEQFTTECRTDLVAIDGTPVAVRVSGSVADAMSGELLSATVCDDAPILLEGGEHVVTGQESRRIGLNVDRVVLGGPVPGGDAASRETGSSASTATVVDESRTGRTVEVTGCDDGCWLIQGEGFHSGWKATIDGESLGPPQLISGGFNGWWVPPASERPDSPGAVTVEIEWTVQRRLHIALAVSALAAIGAVVLIVRERRVPPAPPVEPARLRFFGPSDGLVRSIIAAGVYAAAAALFVQPGYAWWGLAGGALIVATRRVRVAAYVAVAGLVKIAYHVTTFVRREHPQPTPSFPGHFENLHWLGLFVAVSLGVSALARNRPAEPSSRLVRRAGRGCRSLRRTRR